MLKHSDEYESLTQGIIGCGIHVHQYYGAGLLESIYTSAFIIELKDSGYRVHAGRRLAMQYKGRPLDVDFIIDIVVNDLVVVVVKAVEKVLPVHRAQAITYLKLTGCPIGLVMNFNVPLLRDGVHRLIHPDHYVRKTPEETPPKVL
jgi:GxxExxY protein